MFKIKMHFDNVDNCQDKDLRVEGTIEFEDSGEGFDNLSLLNDFIDRLQKQNENSVKEEPPVFNFHLATEASDEHTLTFTAPVENNPAVETLFDPEPVDTRDEEDLMPKFITSQQYYQQKPEYEKNEIGYDYVTKRWMDEHGIEIIPIYMLSEDNISYVEQTNCPGFLYIRDDKMRRDYMISVTHEAEEE